MTRAILLGLFVLLLVGVGAALFLEAEPAPRPSRTLVFARQDLRSSNGEGPPAAVSSGERPQTAVRGAKRFAVRVIGQCFDVTGAPFGGVSIAVDHPFLHRSVDAEGASNRHAFEHAEPLRVVSAADGSVDCLVVLDPKVGVQDDSLWIECSVPGCTTVRGGFLSCPPAGGVLDLGRVELLPRAGFLAVVVDERGEPVEGVGVGVELEWPRLTGRPQHEGRFGWSGRDGLLVLGSGSSVLRSAPGFPCGSWPIVLSDGFELIEPRQLVVRGDEGLVTPTIRVRRRDASEQIFGVVLDADGRRVAGARVRVERAPWSPFLAFRAPETDRYGQFSVFRVGAQQQQHAVILVDRGSTASGNAWFRSEPVPWGAWEHLIVLDRGDPTWPGAPLSQRILRVQLVDGLGDPISGSEVELIEPRGRPVTVRSDVYFRPGARRVGIPEGLSPDRAIAWSRGTSDADGFVELCCPESATGLVLRAEGELYEPRLVRVVDLEEVDGRLRLVATHSGRLEGRFAEAPLLRRFLALPDHPPHGHWIRVAVARPGSAVGRVAPPRSSWVSVDPLDGSFTISGIESGLWSVHLAWSPPGDSLSSVRTEWLSEPVATVLARSGEVTDFEAEIGAKTPAVIRGAVRVEGAPLRRARVRLRRHRLAEASARSRPELLAGPRTDGLGRFAVGGLLPGRYTVEAQPMDDPRGAWLDAGSVDVTWGTDLDQTFDAAPR